MTNENAIFLCYRRVDSNPATFGIYERLCEEFSSTAVFIDRNDYHAGEAWRELTRPILESARAMVVVINKDWVEIAQQRFSNADDPVRCELELAFETGCTVIPVTVDGTSTLSKADVEAIAGDNAAVRTTLGALHALTSLPVRFTNDFQPDMQKLIDELKRDPELVSTGQSAALEVGGLQLHRTWRLRPARPAQTADGKGSDLWMLQAKYAAVPLVGRDADLQSLLEWVVQVEDRRFSVSVRLLIGAAGSGKTRLAHELLQQMFEQHAEHWQAGMVEPASLRKLLRENHLSRFQWHRPTLLVIDYALPLANELRQWLKELTLKAMDRSLPALRILLLERDANTDEGWFSRLLQTEHSSGGEVASALFDPPEPVRLQMLEHNQLRRKMLDKTLELAFEGSAITLRSPEQGRSESFDQRLADPQWSNPLTLMMAALEAATRYRAAKSGIAKTDQATAYLIESLSYQRGDLATLIARHEISRLSRFAPDQHDSNGEQLIAYLAACATMTGGLPSADALRFIDAELQALGRNWPQGNGDLLQRLTNALPDEHLQVAAVQPDIVAEALVIQVLRDWDANEPADVVLRLATNHNTAVASFLFRAFQNHSADEGKARILLRCIRAFADSGLQANVDWLWSMQSVLPFSSIALRELSVEVTAALYHTAKGLSEPGAEDNAALLGMLANNLGVRLSEVGRREEAQQVAAEAVEIYSELSALNPDAFKPYLAMSVSVLGDMQKNNGDGTAALNSYIESMQLLLPYFRQVPQAYAGLLGATARDYVETTQSLGLEPNFEEFAEIVEIFNRLQQNE